MNAHGSPSPLTLKVINTAVRTWNVALKSHGPLTHTWASKSVYVNLSLIQINSKLCSIVGIHVSYTRLCKISVFWKYEMTASRSDGTGLPKHATLYTTYSTIGCTACLYEPFPFFNNYSYRNGSQNRCGDFSFGKKIKLNIFYLFKFIIYHFYKKKSYMICTSHQMLCERWSKNEWVGRGM